MEQHQLQVNISPLLPNQPHGDKSHTQPSAETDGDKSEKDAPTESGSTTSIPDGGFVAWLQCAGSFSLFMSTWGIVSSFGVFQSYYEDAYPDQSPSNISWIGSIQAFFLISLGIFSGPLYDYGFLRSLVLIGSMLTVTGMMLTSLCTHYWQLVLSQGVLLGLGSGCLFVPSIAVLPEYFRKRQSLALGIGASGSALGGIIFPIIFHELQPRIGFSWTTRIIAFIMLLLLIIPVLGMRSRILPSTARRLFDAKAMKELPFSLSCVFLFFAFLGAYIPTFYIQDYAVNDKSLGNKLTAYLVPLLNTGSLFGRIIPPYMADKVGVFNVEIICVTITGMLAFAWIAVHNVPGVVVFSLFYGFFSGAITSLSPNIAVALSPDMGVFGVRLGMLLIPISVGLLLGNPIAGAILLSGWINIQAFAGAMITAAAACIITIRVVMYGWDWRRRC